MTVKSRQQEHIHTLPTVSAYGGGETADTTARPQSMP